MTEKRVTYRQDWPAYNRAQTEERDHVQLLLRGLCDGIVQPPRKPALVVRPLCSLTSSTRRR